MIYPYDDANIVPLLQIAGKRKPAQWLALVIRNELNQLER